VKILAVSDKVMDVIYSPAINQNFGDVDLVLACGDLPFYYLEFIVSSLNVPCYFVYGNHDFNVRQTLEGPVTVHPPGWVNLDEHSTWAKGLLLAGLEGSVRYRPDGVHQYTQTDMRWKALRLTPKLIANRLQYGRYLDILIAHSPPFGIHDGPDYPHYGFEVFLTLMERFRPRYLLHGHKHVYGLEPTRTAFHETEVINVYPYRVIEVDVSDE
jgi:Icc-related predicted phosphoesterase